jgi:hypothetical protein
LKYSTSSTQIAYFNYQGNLYIDGNLYDNQCDSRIKSNIQDFTSDIEKFKDIQLRKFERTDKNNLTDIGVIAQELKEIFPDCINISQSINDPEISDFHFVNTNKLLTHTLSVVQQLIKRVEALESSNNSDSD